MDKATNLVNSEIATADILVRVLVVIVSVIIIGLLIRIAMRWQRNSAKLKYINDEIRNSEGEEKKEWKRKKKNIITSIFFF